MQRIAYSTLPLLDSSLTTNAFSKPEASAHFGQLSPREIRLLNSALKQTPGLLAQTGVAICFPDDHLIAPVDDQPYSHHIVVPKGEPVQIIGRIRKQDTFNAVQQANVVTRDGWTYPEIFESDIPHKLLVLASPEVDGPFTIVEREVHWFSKLLHPLDKLSKDFIMLLAAGK